MPRRNNNPNTLNRGRFQAQGGGLEESRSWAEVEIPTKGNGHGYLNELKAQLQPADLELRQSCFERANKWVDEAPSKGYVVVTPVKTSFLMIPPKKGIRVDGELYSGAAFKD